MGNMRKAHHIAPEVREQILKRIKEEGVSVSVAAKDAGISTATIYGWLGRGLKNAPTVGRDGSSETGESGTPRARG